MDRLRHLIFNFGTWLGGALFVCIFWALSLGSAYWMLWFVLTVILALVLIAWFVTYFANKDARRAAGLTT